VAALTRLVLRVITSPAATEPVDTTLFTLIEMLIWVLRLACGMSKIPVELVARFPPELMLKPKLALGLAAAEAEVAGMTTRATAAIAIVEVSTANFFKNVDFTEFPFILNGIFLQA
jgi:hypothetical protein